jgi:hypothetical protein
MKAKFAICAASLALLVTIVIPMYAHHPFMAQFDPNKTVTLKGTVTKVDWANPHTHISMDVQDANGQTANWDIELGGLKKLTSLGWKKDSIKMGDQITVNGWKARDGSNLASANTITMADGKKLNAGSSYYDQKGAKAPISN